MNSENCLSKNDLEFLVKHLSEIETNKSKIIDEYFDDSLENPREFEYLVNNYIHRVRDFVGYIKESNALDEYIPFVTVGSEVTVKDLGNDEHFVFRIVAPFESQREKQNIFDVSCVSPVGRALLLSKIGDEVEVQAPGGVFYYEVESIKYY